MSVEKKCQRSGWSGFGPFVYYREHHTTCPVEPMHRAPNRVSRRPGPNIYIYIYIKERTNEGRKEVSKYQRIKESTTHVPRRMLPRAYANDATCQDKCCHGECCHVPMQMMQRASTNVATCLDKCGNMPRQTVFCAPRQQQQHKQCITQKRHVQKENRSSQNVQN